MTQEHPRSACSEGTRALAFQASASSGRREKTLRASISSRREARAVRTRRLAIELAERLETKGKDPATAGEVVRFVLGGVRLRLDGKNLTEYLLFLGEIELDGISALCLERWDDLVESMESASHGLVGRNRKRPCIEGGNAEGGPRRHTEGNPAHTGWRQVCGHSAIRSPCRGPAG